MTTLTVRRRALVVAFTTTLAVLSLTSACPVRSEPEPSPTVLSDAR
jgi:hypothetical protein